MYTGWRSTIYSIQATALTMCACVCVCVLMAMHAWMHPWMCNVTKGEKLLQQKQQVVVACNLQLIYFYCCKHNTAFNSNQFKQTKNLLQLFSFLFFLFGENINYYYIFIFTLLYITLIALHCIAIVVVVGLFCFVLF